MIQVGACNLDHDAPPVSEDVVAESRRCKYHDTSSRLVVTGSYRVAIDRWSTGAQHKGPASISWRLAQARFAQFHEDLVQLSVQRRQPSKGPCSN